MSDTPLSGSGLFGALSVAVVWALREIAGQVIKRFGARAGRIGCIQKECGFYCKVRTDDGRVLDTLFQPDKMFLDQQALELRITADLFNDSDTPAIFTKPVVRFIGPEGNRIIHKTPRVFTKGQEISTFMIPAHGILEFTILVLLPRGRLQPTYAQTIPFLDVERPSGTNRSFRLSNVSFYGYPMAAWPRKGSLPIVLPPFSSDQERSSSAHEESAKD